MGTLQQRIAITGDKEVVSALQKVGQAGRETFSTLAQAQGEAAKSGADLNASLRSTVEAASSNGSALGSAFSALISGAKSAAETVAGLGVAFSAVSGVLSAFGASAGAAADALGRAAEKSHLTIEGYQGLTAAAMGSGKSASVVADGMRSLSDMAVRLRTELNLHRSTYSANAKALVDMRQYGVDAMDGLASSAGSAGDRVGGLGVRAQIYARMFGQLGVNFRAFNGSVEQTQLAIDRIALGLEKMPEGYRKAETIRALGHVMGPEFAELVSRGYTALKTQAEAVNGIIAPITEAERKIGQESVAASGLLSAVAERARIRLGLIFTPFSSASQVNLAKFIGFAASAIDSLVNEHIGPALQVVRGFVKGLTGFDIAPDFSKAADSAGGMKDKIQDAAYAASEMDGHSRLVRDSTLAAKFAAVGLDEGFVHIESSAEKAAKTTGEIPKQVSAAQQRAEGLGKTFREELWGGLQQSAASVGAAIRKTFLEVWGAIGQFAAKSDLTTWDGIVRGSTAAWDAVKKGAEEALAWISERVGDIRLNGWDGIVRTAAAVWGQVKDISERAWRGVISVLESDDGRKIWDSFASGTQEAWTAISGVVSLAYRGVKERALEAAPALRAPWEALESAIQGAWGKALEIVGSSISSIRNMVAGLGFDGTWDGFIAAAQVAWERVKEVVSAGYQWVKATSTEILPSLGAVWAQLEAGASAAMDAIKAAFEAGWQGLAASIGGAVSSMWGQIKELAKGTAEFFASGDVSAADKFKAILTVIGALTPALVIAKAQFGDVLTEVDNGVVIFALAGEAMGGLAATLGILAVALLPVGPALSSAFSALKEGKSPTEALGAAWETLKGIASDVATIVGGVVVGSFRALNAVVQPISSLLSAVFGRNVSAEALTISGVILYMSGAFKVLTGSVSAFWTVAKFVFAGQIVSDISAMGKGVSGLAGTIAGIGKSLIAAFAGLSLPALAGLGVIGGAVALVALNFDKLRSVAIDVLNDISGKGAAGAKTFEGAWVDAIEHIKAEHKNLYLVAVGLASPIETAKHLLDGTYKEWVEGLTKVVDATEKAHAKIAESAGASAEKSTDFYKEFGDKISTLYDKIAGKSKDGADAISSGVNKASDTAAALGVAPVTGAAGGQRRAGGFVETAPGQWKRSDAAASNPATDKAPQEQVGILREISGLLREFLAKAAPASKPEGAAAPQPAASFSPASAPQPAAAAPAQPAAVFAPPLAEMQRRAREEAAASQRLPAPAEPARPTKDLFSEEPEEKYRRKKLLLDEIPGHYDGGLIEGSGSGTSDSNLRKLSKGEYVVKKSAVDHYGKSFFDAVNRMQKPKNAQEKTVNLGIKETLAAARDRFLPQGGISGALAKAQQGWQAARSGAGSIGAAISDAGERWQTAMRGPGSISDAVSKSASGWSESLFGKGSLSSAIAQSSQSWQDIMQGAPWQGMTNSLVPAIGRLPSADSGREYGRPMSISLPNGKRYDLTALADKGLLDELERDSILQQLTTTGRSPSRVR